MNIWIVQIGELLPLDDGVRKMRNAMLADKLIEKGHAVTWWASAFNHFSKQWIRRTDTEIEIKKNLTIRVLKGSGYKKNFSISRYIDHRIIAWKFKKQRFTAHF